MGKGGKGKGYQKKGTSRGWGQQKGKGKAKGKGKGTVRKPAFQKPQQSQQKSFVVDVRVLKKSNWLNRQGFFGKQSIDEDALEMLGTIPPDRAMTILENAEAKASAGEIWNPNSYVVKAVIRHSQELNAPRDAGPAVSQPEQIAPMSVMKKVDWLNRQGYFGRNEIDVDAVEMLGTIPKLRAMTILENMEEKVGFGEIWNPNKYIVNAVIRHSKSLANEDATYSQPPAAAPRRAPPRASLTIAPRRKTIGKFAGRQAATRSALRTGKGKGKRSGKAKGRGYAYAIAVRATGKGKGKRSKKR